MTKTTFQSGSACLCMFMYMFLRKKKLQTTELRLICFLSFNLAFYKRADSAPGAEQSLQPVKFPIIQKKNLNSPYHENNSDSCACKLNYLSTVTCSHRMKPNSTLFSKKPYPFLLRKDGNKNEYCTD